MSLVIGFINPIHFGVIICINLTIGFLTHPVGTSIFSVSSIAEVKTLNQNSNVYTAIRNNNAIPRNLLGTNNIIHS
jgi:TRAP-type C4-dicarboxylate transport system permease large subunit